MKMKDRYLFHCNCGPTGCWWGLVAFKAKGLSAGQGALVQGFWILTWLIWVRNGKPTRFLVPDKAKEANFEKVTLLSLDSEEINQVWVHSMFLFICLLVPRNFFFFFFLPCGQNISNELILYLIFSKNKKVKLGSLTLLVEVEIRLQSSILFSIATQ